jgi:hypothetical protein
VAVLCNASLMMSHAIERPLAVGATGISHWPIRSLVWEGSRRSCEVATGRHRPSVNKVSLIMGIVLRWFARS